MFGRLGPLEIIIILALLLLVFGGRGKISAMMGDMAKGIKSFRKGLKDGDQTAEEAASGTSSPAGLIGEPINVTPEKDKTKA
jgi:sec-independent protein translocase protein TatA